MKKKPTLKFLILVTICLVFGLGNATASDNSSNCQFIDEFLVVEFQGCTGSYCHFEVLYTVPGACNWSGAVIGDVVQIDKSMVPSAITSKTCSGGAAVRVGRVVINYFTSSFTHGAVYCWPP